MEKASKAIRRSAIRLKALSGGGHTDLNMVISELRDIYQAARIFMQAQQTASQDLLKWSASAEHRAIQDIVSQLAELNSVWFDVQKEFTEHLRDYRFQFEMILGGERHVDQARQHLLFCEQREMKVKKELKKATKKATAEELKQLEIRLSQAERARDLAQIEVMDRIRDNETVKLTRVKEALMNVSEAYCELAAKCALIFQAQKDITHYFPDGRQNDLEEQKYTGCGATKQIVIRTKDDVRRYRRNSYHLIPTSNFMVDDPPPPYSVAFCDSEYGGSVDLLDEDAADVCDTWSDDLRPFRTVNSNSNQSTNLESATINISNYFGESGERNIYPPVPLPRHNLEQPLLAQPVAQRQRAIANPRPSTPPESANPTTIDILGQNAINNSQDNGNVDELSGALAAAKI